MTQESRRVEVVPYNPAWPGMFAAEAELIRRALGPHCVEIHHIGSTSVPGLSAKRDIDILCIVDQLSACPALQNLGYVLKGELNIPLRAFLSKNTSESKVNLHVTEPDHAFIRLNLRFRDYLRQHKDARLAYEALKYRLLEDPRSRQKSTPYFTDYSMGKNCFIKDILKKAGFTDLCVNFCAHDNEWAAYHRIFDHRNAQDSTDCKMHGRDETGEFGAVASPIRPADKSCASASFVLYRGATIVAAACVELCPNRAVVTALAVDEPYKSLRYDVYMADFLARWAQHHGRIMDDRLWIMNDKL